MRGIASLGLSSFRQLQKESLDVRKDSWSSRSTFASPKKSFILEFSGIHYSSRPWAAGTLFDTLALLATETLTGGIMDFGEKGLNHQEDALKA